MTQFKKFWYEITAKLDRLTAPAAGRWLPRKKSTRMYVLTGGIFFVVIAITLLMTGGSSNNNNQQMGTFIVREGDLTISVTESGSLKARNAVDIKSEVEGQATIISIVKEGTYIKPEDVNNKILVELDSSGVRERLTQQEITFANTKSSYTDANQAYLIQQKQNESDISQGQLDRQFALIDLQKYLGQSVAARLLSSAGSGTDPNCDIASLVDDPNLGGDALQKLREAQSTIDLASAQLKQAQSKLGWTQKLFEKKYVAGDELEGDRLTEKSNAISLDKAKTAIDLFRQYEFPKQAREFLSKYIEAGRKLDRTEAQAKSRLAQAEAKLTSAKAAYDLQSNQLEKLKKQLAACVIKAPAAGLVVYSDNESRRWQQNPIQVGATVSQRQNIISLPNTAEMSVEIKVHESSVDKVRPNLPVTITIDAFPDQTFTGKVLKVAPLPDQQNSWLNPDLKVYVSEVSIDGTHDFLKPGMSAKVEILVNRLSDVTYVPVQAVCNQGGKKVCYFAENTPRPVTVTTGLFNDNFVHITDGLSVGQIVLLNPPTAVETEKKSDRATPADHNAGSKQTTATKLAAKTSESAGK